MSNCPSHMEFLSGCNLDLSLKGFKRTFSSIFISGTSPKEIPQKSQEHQLNPPLASETGVQIPSSDASGNGNIQESEAGYSICIKGLPMTATVSLLENAFNNFWPIRSGGGIQIRSNIQHGFCFGFVECQLPLKKQLSFENDDYQGFDEEAVTIKGKDC